MEFCPLYAQGAGEVRILSEVARGLIVQAVESGRSYRDVAEEAGCLPATILNIFQCWETHQTLDKKPRSWRPRKLTVQ
jgi:cytidylate kinase